jgi:hypothetical protein
MGGLPEHIKVDMEMQAPQDLQLAMYLAHAFERNATTFHPARGAQPSPRPTLPHPHAAAAGAGSVAPQASSGASSPVRPFRRLSLAEQLEHHHLGLCYNCDEPYVHGHVCQWLFYLESTDYLNDEVPAKVAVGVTFQDLPVDHAAAPKATGADAAVQPIVSLHAIADIHSKNTMLLPVMVHGHQLVALLDSGSATNFIKADLMRRLQLVTTPHPTL